MPVEVCKSDMISCAIECQPSEAAFDVWPPKTERASQGKRPFLESVFFDQATLNGTRPNSPAGVKPARPLVGP